MPGAGDEVQHPASGRSVHSTGDAINCFPSHEQVTSFHDLQMSVCVCRGRGVGAEGEWSHVCTAFLWAARPFASVSLGTALALIAVMQRQTQMRAQQRCSQRVAGTRPSLLAPRTTSLARPGPQRLGARSVQVNQPGASGWSPPNLETAALSQQQAVASTNVLSRPCAIWSGLARPSDPPHAGRSNQCARECSSVEELAATYT